MKYFTKTAHGWIQLTIFAKSSILNVSQGDEYVSDYPEAFSIEAVTLNLSRIFLIWLVFYYRAEIFPLGAIKLYLKSVRTSPWRKRKDYTKVLWLFYW